MKVTPLFALFLVFLVLKLTNVVAWSWWWVAAPMWIPLSMSAVLYSIAGIGYGVYWLLSTPKERAVASAMRSLERLSKGTK
jgi:hypothetical protein